MTSHWERIAATLADVVIEQREELRILRQLYSDRFKSAAEQRRFEELERCRQSNRGLTEVIGGPV